MIILFKKMLTLKFDIIIKNSINIIISIDESISGDRKKPQ